MGEKARYKVCDDSKVLFKSDGYTECQQAAFGYVRGLRKAKDRKTEIYISFGGMILWDSGTLGL